MSEMAYVATVPGCECIVACVVDDPAHSRDTARDIAVWVRDGLTVERHSVEDVREMKFRRCVHRAKGRASQPSLLDVMEVTP